MQPWMGKKKSDTVSGSVVYDSLWAMDRSQLGSCPGKNTGVGSHSLLQGIFPTQR